MDPFRNFRNMEFERTIGRELRRTAERYPNVAAFHYRGRDRTFREWDAEADRFARALLAAGCRKGDRLALLLPPVPEYMFFYIGAARIGVITAGISTRYRRQEIREILSNAEPRVVVSVKEAAGVDLIEIVNEVAAEVRSIERVVPFSSRDNGIGGFLAAGDRLSVDLGSVEAAVREDDPIAIVYTSGTTGTPKGAVYDSAAMIALTRLFSRRLSGLPPPGVPNLWPGMSLTHVGAMARVHIHIAFAGTMVLHDQFDVKWCIEQIFRFRPQRLGGFPPVLVRIVRDPDFARRDHSFIKAVTFGGAPLAPHLAEEIRNCIGAEVYTGYSCTETCIISATLPGDPPEQLRTSVGRPSEGVELKIVDEERRTVPAGIAGRIAVRSPATMRGYWRDAEATARALDPEGWLYTEDFGYLDAGGYLHLLGRDKDMYFRSGFNVYPGEIEAVLAEHPKVAEAAVVGVPDDVLGQKGWAFVVPVDPADLPVLEELRDFVGQRLASYKRPDAVTVITALPRNSMYKVDKRALRDLALRLSNEQDRFADGSPR